MYAIGSFLRFDRLLRFTNYHLLRSRRGAPHSYMGRYEFFLRHLHTWLTTPCGFELFLGFRARLHISTANKTHKREPNVISILSIWTFVEFSSHLIRNETILGCIIQFFLISHCSMRRDIIWRKLSIHSVELAELSHTYSSIISSPHLPICEAWSQGQKYNRDISQCGEGKFFC